MLKNFVRGKLNEKAETLPASIVTGVVSSFILLSVAGIIGLLVEKQSEAEVTALVNMTASNIETSLNTDSTAATLIEPVDNKNVVFHVPSGEGTECKLITWNVEGSSLSRTLKIVEGTVSGPSGYSCDETSSVVIENKKTFTKRLVGDSSFEYFNAMGRELQAQGGSVSHKDPSACAMGAQATDSGCPATEPEVEEAWNSVMVSDISFTFSLRIGDTEITRYVV